MTSPRPLYHTLMQRPQPRATSLIVLCLLETLTPPSHTRSSIAALPCGAQAMHSSLLPRRRPSPSYTQVGSAGLMDSSCRFICRSIFISHPSFCLAYRCFPPPCLSPSSPSLFAGRPRPWPLPPRGAPRGRFSARNPLTRVAPHL